MTPWKSMVFWYFIMVSQNDSSLNWIPSYKKQYEAWYKIMINVFTTTIWVLIYIVVAPSSKNLNLWNKKNLKGKGDNHVNRNVLPYARPGQIDVGQGRDILVQRVILVFRFEHLWKENCRQDNGLKVSVKYDFQRCNMLRQLRWSRMEF